MPVSDGVLQPLSEILPIELIPGDFLAQTGGDGTFLDRIYVLDSTCVQTTNGTLMGATVVFDGELTVPIPGCSSVSLVIGAGKTDYTVVPVRVLIGSDWSIELHDFQFALRFDRSILRPVEPTAQFTELPLTTTIRLTRHGFEFGGDDTTLSLCKSFLGETQVAIEATGIKFDFSRDRALPKTLEAGFDESFVGVYIEKAAITLPPDVGVPVAPSKLAFTECFIGSGGFTGRFETTWADGEAVGTLAGFGFELKSLALELRESSFVEASLGGVLTNVPFFDKPVAVDVSFGAGGNISASLAAVQLQPQTITTTPEGLVRLSIPWVADVDVRSLTIEKEGDVGRIFLSGRVTPKLDIGSAWPSFELRRLGVDTRGHVILDGGWLNLPSQYSLDFYGAQLAISKLGFGNTDDGRKWIGFSGGITLVEGIPAGASVDGLRVSWGDGGVRVSLDGIKLQLEVPDALRLEGAVSYKETDGIHQFVGAAKVHLVSLNMQVDAKVVIGRKTGEAFNYLGVYLAAELPAGIPVFSTGIGIYGLAGLFASNMEPNKGAEEAWYDWYKKPPVGIANIDTEKWRAKRDALAFGAGVTLGTLSDNGHAFNGRFLLAILFPGPILLLEGKANLLKERAKLDAGEPLFRALAVLDCRVGTLRIGLDAQYKYGDSGQLIDIRGSADAFFDFHDAGAWYVHIGVKEPKEKRIQAKLFKTFTASSYLMVDAHALATGAWFGYRKSLSAGPVGVSLEAWVDGNALLSFKPAHFSGNLALHGSAELSAFGAHLGVTVDANIAADVFDPYHILGHFDAYIRLPWPIGRVGGSVTLEWGPETNPPPLPVPLKEVAVEHFKATASWSLPRTSQITDPAQLYPYLDPDYDRGEGFLNEAPLPSTLPDDFLQKLPIVPLDARPHLTFTRAVNDDARVGVNMQPLSPEWERIGDPAKNEGPVSVRFGLKSIALQKYDTSPNRPTPWKTVALSPASGGVPTLYGSWAALPRMPDGGGENAGQTKLWLWSKTPFDYRLHTGRAWDEWFGTRFPGYPLGGTDASSGWDFEGIDPAALPDPWRHPDEPDLVFHSPKTPAAIEELDPPMFGRTQALWLSTLAGVTIDLPEPADHILIDTYYEYTGRVIAGYAAAAADGTRARYVARSVPRSASAPPRLEIKGPRMVRLVVEPIANGARTDLATSLSGSGGYAVGGAYDATRNRVLFVERRSGAAEASSIWAVNLGGNGLPELVGTGYTDLQDIGVLSDGTAAYVTQGGSPGGALLRVPLTLGRCDRSNPNVRVVTTLSNPRQIAIDEGVPGVRPGSVYVVERGANRLVRVLVDSLFKLKYIVATGLPYANGVALSADLAYAFVSHQQTDDKGYEMSSGVIRRVTLATGASEVVYTNILAPHYLRVLPMTGTQLLVTQRDPSNSVGILDMETRRYRTLVSSMPVRPSSSLILPDGRLVSFCDKLVCAYDFNLRFLQINTVNVVRWNFEDVAPGPIPDPWTLPDPSLGLPDPHLVFHTPGGAADVIALASPMRGLHRALEISTLAGLSVELPQATSAFQLETDRTYPQGIFVAYDEDGGAHPSRAKTDTAPGSSAVTYQELRSATSGSPMPPFARIDVAPIVTSAATTSTAPVAGVMGSAVNAAVRKLFLVEAPSDAAGMARISFVDVSTGTPTGYTVLGTGYTALRGIAVTDDGTTAFVTEQGGAVLRVTLTPGQADRASAVTVVDGLAAPRQIALDASGTKAFVVEQAGAQRLLEIPLASIPATPMARAFGLASAVGVLVSADGAFAYVSEQGTGQVRRFQLADGASTVLASGLTAPSFLAWADAGRQRILVTEGATLNRVSIVDLSAAAPTRTTVVESVPATLSSVAVLPGRKLATCGGTAISTYDLAVRILELRDLKAEIILEHIREELTRWQGEGAVLEPDTAYRLKIVTTLETKDFADGGFNRKRQQEQYAYFATGGPPGTNATLKWTAPAIEDLSRYVTDTMPPAAPDGATPAPAYRAYDVGISFNENYVETMYRVGRRDLSLHVRDGNGRVRDDNGRMLVIRNGWDRAGTLTLTEADLSYLALLSANGYFLTDPETTVIRSNTLAASADRHVLPRSSIQEICLQPVQLQEDFSTYERGATAMAAYPLGYWKVYDGAVASRWEVKQEPLDPEAQYLWQSEAAVDSVLVYERGTPAEWSDYRFSVVLRPTQSSGVVFRYQDAGNHYRLWLEQDGVARTSFLKLERRVAGVPTLLASRQLPYSDDTDRRISVEAVNGNVTVVLDGKKIAFTAAELPEETVLTSGRVGLFARGQSRFKEARVDDFRADAPVLYRFPLATSRYADFFHHLHDHQDETWTAALPTEVSVAAALAQAVDPATLSPPTQAESDAAAALAAATPEATATPDVPVKVTRVEQGGVPVALRLDALEPIDWARTSITSVLGADRAPAQATAAPGNVKLTDVAFATVPGDRDAVTLLVREPMDLAGTTVEHRRWIFADSFDDLLASWTNHAQDGQVGEWSVPAPGGAVCQTSMAGGDDPADPLKKPGTILLANPGVGVRCAATVHMGWYPPEPTATPAGSMGVVFRYVDDWNHHRFTIDADAGTYLLVSVRDGVASILADRTAVIETGRDYVVEIVSTDTRIGVSIDGAAVIDVSTTPTSGDRIGLYCWKNPAARFAEVNVAEPTWSAFHAFAPGGGVIAAGTRARVYTGADPGSRISTEKNVVEVFAGGPVVLHPAGADLRIVRAGGPEHSRRFLGDAAYVVVASRVLRTAGGSTLFVLPAAGPLAPREYRLELAYRRDNSAAAPESVILSEAGESTPEAVRIDVPWRTR